jgi:hypothetical protein
MSLARENKVFDHEGNLIETKVLTYSWDYIKQERKMWLEKTDLWYFNDRWEGLSSEAKEQLNSFRKSLRDLPDDFPLESDACDNFPEPEEWF